MPMATARRPEPQTWLMPKAVAALRTFLRSKGGLPGGVLTCPGRKHLPHDNLVYVIDRDT